MGEKTEHSKLSEREIQTEKGKCSFQRQLRREAKERGVVGFHSFYTWDRPSREEAPKSKPNYIG